MFDLLNHLFGTVCGQNPDHTWLPGGIWLPFCQRCTGLYVGAGAAAVLHLLVRPAPTNRWLWLNGGMLLFMIPFGLHWLPQGPVLRTMTGVLFGFGLVAFLGLPLVKASTPLPAGKHGMEAARRAGSCAPHVIGLLVTLGLVPWLGAKGNGLAADLLTVLGAGGALVLFGLALGNSALALRWMIRRRLQGTTRAAA